LWPDWRVLGSGRNRYNSCFGLEEVLLAVDFKKLREMKKQQDVVDPLEIFRRLPKSARIKDLYGSQGEVLQAWFNHRDKGDHILKLHTGGGKTLVGLLIAQSTMNETREPALFICPNNQLVKQTLEKASEYSISAVPYAKPFPDEFVNAKSVLVANYAALFNGNSRFGLRGRDVLKLGCVIVDDAHVGSGILRDQFTIRLRRDDPNELYATVSSVFRQAFKEIGKLGTFDDVVNGVDYRVIEVPNWSWHEKLDEVQALLRANARGKYELEWFFLRDNLKYCECLITKDVVAITPVFPLVDLIPSFSECRHRIFMSATIPDDSEIVRAFDANPESLLRPLTSTSVAGVSERMILVPDLMELKINDVPGTIKKLAHNAAKSKRSTAILVPSGAAAKTWEDVAIYPNTPELVETKLRELVEGKTHGPIVLANRYDGIDLPDDSCRVLIIAGLPRAVGEYETYRANAFLGAASINRAIAQKIEQGMGRAARGPGDYCVVLIIGSDLVAWLGRETNLRFLTTSTHAQLEMGVEVSKNVSRREEFVDIVNRCLNREKEWVKYHAETLAELTLNVKVEQDAIDSATAERRALQLWRDGYHEKAIAKLTKRADDKKTEGAERGWLLQFAGAIAFDWGKKDLANEFQQRAFADNRNLSRARAGAIRMEPVLPGPQAEAITRRIGPFRFKRGYIAEFDDMTSFLIPTASSDQFEEALCRLGSVLGFEASRPEKTLGNGPDVLWVVSRKTGLIIEAKSRKNEQNALTRTQHGQLLVAENWFKESHPKLSGIRVSVHPNVTATKKSVPNNTKALTLAKLNELITESRNLIVALCESGHPDAELTAYCEELLRTSNLTPQELTERYLVDFEVRETD
jgi:replicative superfamily II helicase